MPSGYTKQAPPYYGAKVKCLVCGDIVQSATVHDFKTCKCWVETRNKKNPTGIAVDGGSSYFKFSYTDPSKYEIMDSGNYKND